MKKIFVILVLFTMVFSVFIAGAVSVKASWTIRQNLPNKNEAAWKYYSAPINNYPLSPLNGGNCTWYAYGRAYEVHGFDSGLGAMGNAKNWYWGAYENSPWQVDTTPAAGAVLCWEGGGYGHVGFVESVNNDGTVTWSESNYGMEGYNYPAFRVVTMNPNNYFSGFQGYIHVGTPKGSSPSTTIEYSSINEGTYYIKNNYNGEYLSVAEAKDVNGQNINSWEYNGGSEERMILTKASSGYKIRPECSSSRLVNAYGNTVKSGNNVNLWDDWNESSQWWGFEAVSGGYVIRNMMNPSCVLTVTKTDTSIREIVVSTYTGASSQIWTIQNTISYNANGGNGAPSMQMKSYGKNLTLSTTKPTRTGYTFLGWSTSSSATSATYTAGGTFSSNSNVTLYAVWKKTTYTVTYNANGGSGAPSSQTKTYGVDLTLSTTKPTRTGYTFLGWSTSSSATSATYTAGGKYTSNSKVTLYAVWKCINNGWIYENNSWYYYEKGVKVKNDWRKDSNGWCYLDQNGKWVLNTFVKDSTGKWAYITKDGYYYETTGWIEYSGEWYYLEKGYRVESDWRKDSDGWCYLDETGRWNGIYYNERTRLINEALAVLSRELGIVDLAFTSEYGNVISCNVNAGEGFGQTPSMIGVEIYKDTGLINVYNFEGRISFQYYI